MIILSEKNNKNAKTDVRAKIFNKPKEFISEWEKMPQIEKIKAITAFYKKTVGEKFMPTPEFEQTAEKIKNWLFGQYPEKKWLLLLGKVGTGKTLWAKSITETYNALTRKSSFCFDVRKAKTFAYFNAEQAAKMVCDWDFENLYYREKIFIDDIGIEPVVQNVFGTKKNAIAEILHYRYGNKLPTILTTNLTITELEERYGVRILDRIREIALTIPFISDSFRH